MSANNRGNHGIPDFWLEYQRGGSPGASPGSIFWKAQATRGATSTNFSFSFSSNSPTTSLRASGGLGRRASNFQNTPSQTNFSPSPRSNSPTAGLRASGGSDGGVSTPPNNISGPSFNPPGGRSIFRGNTAGEIFATGTGHRAEPEEVAVEIPAATERDETLHMAFGFSLPEIGRLSLEGSINDDGENISASVTNSENREPNNAAIIGQATADDPETSTVVTTPPKAEPQFLPRFRKLKFGSPELLEERFVGWYRTWGDRCLVMKYGYMENPLCEIIPGRAIGNIQLSQLCVGPTLTEKQQQLGIRSWNDDTKLTNVARSAATAGGRIVVWVELNDEIWITRTELKTLRIGDSNTSFGDTGARSEMARCVRRKRDWYYEAGWTEEADYYFTHFMEVLERPKR